MTVVTVRNPTIDVGCYEVLGVVVVDRSQSGFFHSDLFSRFHGRQTLVAGLLGTMVRGWCGVAIVVVVVVVVVVRRTTARPAALGA